jgi:DNA polymerase III sliding clamp (beta) subunit (PCNA family)
MNTEITLPVPELKQALPGLNKLVGRRTTLPVLGCVKVSRQANGLVTLQATDLDAQATYTLDHTQSGEPVEILVPLEQLNQAFKCSTGAKQDLTLVCEGKTTQLRYFIGGSPVQQPVNTLPLKEWPASPEITVDSTPLQPGFGEALKQAMQCCSGDPSRQILRGACLDARDAKAHYIVGTNGRVLFAANSFTFPLKEALIIPDSKFINGSGLLDQEPCFIAVQPGKKPSEVKHICLRSKQWQFVTREIEGLYPNWKQVVPTVDKSWTQVQLLPPAIEQLLKVIPNLPGNDGNNNTIRLRITEKGLWVEGRNKDDADWTKIAIPEVVITGKPKEIGLNRDYLLPALRFGLNELVVQDEVAPMICRRNGKRMVIMPVSLNGPQKADPEPKTTPATTTPPQPEAGAQPQERKTDMTKTTIKPEAPNPESSPSLMDQIETIKETLKNALHDLTGLVETVKLAEKDQRATEKEVESARATLKKLQQVTI